MDALAIAWGLVLTLLALVCWGGQLVSLVAPRTAMRWGLVEDESEVEPAFWADIRGEALWDVATLWSLVVAGVLLVADVEAWAYFGLVGGGAYLYFAGRGITVRLEMRRRELRIGTRESVRIGFVALMSWGVVAAVTIVAAVVSLAGE